MEYSIDYFIQKFEAIPENQIGEGEIEKHCALYHCGVKTNKDYKNLSEEAIALANIFKPLYHTQEENNLSVYIYSINDGSDNVNGIIENVIGNTPKERLLNSLYKLKAIEIAKELTLPII
jgi:hypothetical protein